MLKFMSVLGFIVICSTAFADFDSDGASSTSNQPHDVVYSRGKHVKTGVFHVLSHESAKGADCALISPADSNRIIFVNDTGKEIGCAQIKIDHSYEINYSDIGDDWAELNGLKDLGPLH